MDFFANTKERLMWILPTRSRPASCQRFIDNWINTESSTDVLVRLDECDSELENIVSLDWPKNFKVKIGKREGVAKATNELFQEFKDEPWYGFLADDFVPKTVHWDKKLAEAASNKFISYPNDMAEREDLPTLPCVGGNLIREIGYFGFPFTHHYYVDTVYQFIGKHLGIIKRLDDVVVEHMHYEFGKSNLDIVYQQSSEKFKNDKSIWKQWIAGDGMLLVEELREKGF
jgi:hypothetical protein